MAALLGADVELAYAVIEAASANGLVEIANDNAAGQIVVSGETKAVEAAMQIARDKGLRRVLPLAVSAFSLRNDGACRRCNGSGAWLYNHAECCGACGLQYYRC